MQTYYELLRVRSGAAPTEIVAAYHAARGILTQSLKRTVSVETSEGRELLKQLDQAYQTLSDPQTRHRYDQLLRLAKTSENRPLAETAPLSEPFTGAQLRVHREALNLSFEDVFKATRIPVHYLRAIEEENKKVLPARVYIQGFLKNLAQLYRLPSQELCHLFLERLETLDA